MLFDAFARLHVCEPDHRVLVECRPGHGEPDDEEHARRSKHARARRHRLRRISDDKGQRLANGVM